MDSETFGLVKAYTYGSYLIHDDVLTQITERVRLVKVDATGKESTLRDKKLAEQGKVTIRFEGNDRIQIYHDYPNENDMLDGAMVRR